MQAKPSRRTRKPAPTPSRKDPSVWRPVGRSLLAVVHEQSDENPRKPKRRRTSKAEWNRIGTAVARAYDRLNAALVEAWGVGDMNVLQHVSERRPLQFEYRITRTVMATVPDKALAADGYEAAVASGPREPTKRVSLRIAARRK